MIRVGITGGIGSGKSTIALIMEIMGIPVYYADKEAKLLTSSSPEIQSGLIEAFGKEIYVGGILNRALLASYVFDNKERLAQLNDITHPVIRKDYEDWLTKQTSGICAMESAILFESGFDNLTDIKVTVSAPEVIRIQRVVNRDNRTKTEIKNIINNQLSDTEREKLSNYIIENDGNKALIPQVEELVEKLLH